MFDTQEFVKERDKVLLSLDKRKIERYMKKYGVRFRPDNETVFWAGVHKAILGINSATEEQKARSARWLIEHGFKPGIVWSDLPDPPEVTAP